MEFCAEKKGGHIWVRVFVGKGVDYTLANAGIIVLDPDQWAALKESILTNTVASLVVIRENEEKNT
jgi:hypothetical protein